MGSYGKMEELGNLILLLLSDGCDYLTGDAIVIDGGHHLAAPSTFAGLSKMSDDDWAKAKEAANDVAEDKEAEALLDQI